MTAVEWLEELFNRGAYRETIKEAFAHAKQMEKKQIIEAYKQGQHDSDPRETDAEDYYNKTFKSE